MDSAITLERLNADLPSLCEQIWKDDVSRPAGLEAAWIEAGMPGRVDFNGGPYGRVELVVTGFGDAAADERRLRTAISRRVGKAVGGDKHWDLGGYELGMHLSGDRLGLRFSTKHSFAAVARAAAAWLAGAEGRSWLVDHDFIEPGAEPNEKGFFSRPSWMAEGPMSRLAGDQVRVQMFLDPGARPPGVTAKSDDDAYRATIDYLCDALGERDDPNPLRRPVWTRGVRKFEFTRMSSRSRSALFSETAG